MAQIADTSIMWCNVDSSDVNFLEEVEKAHSWLRGHTLKYFLMYESEELALIKHYIISY